MPDDQFSLAIGKSGQECRLASRLTGWSIDIVRSEQPVAAVEAQPEEKPSEAVEPQPNKENQ